VNIVVCIPARYESTRFPGKMLARDTGKYLIQHTYEQALKARCPARVLIAADDERIVRAAESFGAPCVLTSRDHMSGTDRIAEAIQSMEADIIVNLQGDEPHINPDHIDQVAQLLMPERESERADHGFPMATLAAPLTDRTAIENPNVVKVIMDKHGRALYFSRSVVPYCRDTGGTGPEHLYLRHIGIYAYRKAFLLQLTTWPRTRLEETEKLEQLRVLENGYSIRVGTVGQVNDGIDTPEQYQAFVDACRAAGGSEV